MKNIAKTLKQFTTLLILCITATGISIAYADQNVLSLFPLNDYDQSISHWINPNDPAYDKPLLSMEMQQKRLAIFNTHYFGEDSPWGQEYVNRILKESAPNDFKTIELDLLHDYSNVGKTGNEIGYAEDFRPYSKNWIDAITYNVNAEQFSGLTYQESNRGIAIDNLHARALPTDDAHFYSYKVAGQGFPFDNLQMSSIWAGTPVYIVGKSRDRAWLLVITPEIIGWVKSSGIAHTNATFINVWTTMAKIRLAAITHTQTSITDEKGNFLFSAYVGSVFPANMTGNGLELMVPTADADHNAIIKNAFVENEEATIMPLTATPHHFANIMKTLIGRPYGWGGIYFYNDCSAEMKSLFAPFGIWLPRHSSEQVNVGKKVDLTSAHKEERLAYLMQHGKRLLTLIYIGGHVVLYVGNYADPYKPGAMMAMTYQNSWGLSPNPSTRRAVIGKSVLFPMLLQFPEDAALKSQADKKYFQVAYLDQMPEPEKKSNATDIKSLMYPEASLLAAVSDFVNIFTL